MSAKNTWLRINYCVNRVTRSRGHRRVVDRLYGKLRIKGEWETAQDKIRKLIRARHPGWFLEGYANVTPPSPC